MSKVVILAIAVAVMTIIGTGVIVRLNGEVGQLQSKLTGQRQDVITCTDLHDLELAMQGGASGGVTGSGYSWLPGHCYNN